MFPITVTIHDPAQLSAVLAALNPEAAARVAQFEAAVNRAEAVEAPPAPAAASRARKPAPAPVEAAPVEAAPVEAAPVEAAPAPSYDEVAAAVTALARTKGRDAALAVLTRFGGAKLPDVPKGNYADVLAACQAASLDPEAA